MRRITRAESVGLQPPQVEDLREAFATFREQLAKTEARLNVFLDAGVGVHSAPQPSVPGRSMAEDIYGWALSNSGSAELADELRNEFIRLRVEEDVAGLRAFEQKMLQIVSDKRGDDAPGVTPLTDALARGSIESFGELLAGVAYGDEAVRQIGVDFAWTLMLEGRESEVDEVRNVFRAQLTDIVHQRNAAIKNGWRYEGERNSLADRELFWESAERELSHWVEEAVRERDRRMRGSRAARLGRAIRRHALRSKGPS